MFALRRRMVRLLTVVVFAPLTCLVLLAPVLIPWLFGPAWEPAVLPTQILAGAGAATVVIDAVGTVLMAAGRSRAMLGYGVAHFVGLHRRRADRLVARPRRRLLGRGRHPRRLRGRRLRGAAAPARRDGAALPVGRHLGRDRRLPRAGRAAAGPSSRCSTTPAPDRSCTCSSSARSPRSPTSAPCGSGSPPTRATCSRWCGGSCRRAAAARDCPPRVGAEGRGGSNRW